MRVSHRFTASSARFDEDNLVSHAGLVPLLGLAQQTRLPQIIAKKVSIKTSGIKSGAANPVPKLLGVIAGMCDGAASIEDLSIAVTRSSNVFADLIDGPLAPLPSGAFRGQLRLGPVRGDRAQPAARQGRSPSTISRELRRSTSRLR